MWHYANPKRFAGLSRKLLPVFAGATVICFSVGLYIALFASPPDYQQGETVRLMYIHVPAAWMAMFVYASMGAAAITGLIWRHTLAEIYPRAVAPVGAVFTAICLITGSLWGYPTWGTWWVWDARLTSVLILFFLYLGYIALVDAFDDEEKGLTAGAMLLIIGLINLPIIKFSVDWWNTLHQPASVFRAGGPTIHPDMLLPLLIMTAGYMFFFSLLSLIRLETAISGRKIRVRQLKEASAGYGR